MRKIQNSKFKIIVLIATILSIAVIILFAFWRYNKVREAEIVLEVPKTVKINQEIDVPLKINTAGQSINAAEVYLKFDPTELEVISLSKDSSFFTLWIKDQPVFSNEKGEISFAGGVPNPGFKGVGQIGGIKMKAKRVGTLTIEFDKKSRALLNDGSGTAIKLKLDPITIKAGK